MHYLSAYFFRGYKITQVFIRRKISHALTRRFFQCYTFEVPNWYLKPSVWLNQQTSLSILTPTYQKAAEWGGFYHPIPLKYICK